MKKIKIYTSPSCGFCFKIKNWMKNNNLEFEEVPINDVKDPVLQKEITGLPYTVITDEDKMNVVIGFNQKKLSEILL